MATEEQTIVDVFGEDCEILTKSGSVQLSSFVGKYVGLYFSAHWCPPCRGFTPKLAEFYEKVIEGGCEWEVIFISSDRDQSAFDDYYGSMPWSALPFNLRELKNRLSSNFKVSGIPTFLLLGPNGDVYNENGTGVVNKPIEAFPWLPPTIGSVLTNDLVVVDKAGNESTFGDTQGKYVGIYVSAHWCPPCRGFTPQLVERYNKAQAEGKDFEIIFCSKDRTLTQFQEYFNEMPWKAIQYSNERVRDDIDEVFSVQGIPRLVILDNTGDEPTIFRENAVNAVKTDTTLIEFPWPKQPSTDLSVDFSGIESLPSVILMQDTTATAQQDITKEFLNVVGQEQLDLGKKQMYNCFTGNTACDVFNKIRALTGVTAQKMVLLDLQDNGAYYTAELPTTLQDIRDFLEGYEKKTITRRQCSR